MDGMYVCTGNTSTTDTEAWVSQARMVLHTDITTTTATRARPSSSVLPSSASNRRSASALRRPGSAVVSAGGATTATTRPPSAVSFASSSRTRGADSGYWSSRKGSSAAGSTADLTATYAPISADEHDAEQDADDKHLPRTAKPITPRPSDSVCVISEDVERRPMVYAPRALTDANTDSPQCTTPDIDSPSSSTQPSFHSLGEIGAVVVGTALKHAVVEVSGESMQDVEQNPQIKNVFPDRKFLGVDKARLEGMSCSVSATDTTDDRTTGRRLAEMLERDTQKASHVERDSDEDSLLNSDEDYDEDRDAFFRKPRPSQNLADLSTHKGITHFKEFLKGTLGEKTWNLWLDIEKARTTSPQDLSR